MPWVNPVFVVGGSLGEPDFSGVQLGHFSRREGGVVVRIAMPTAAISAQNLRDPIVSGLRMANAAAFHFFDDKGMSFPLKAAEDLVSRVEQELDDFK
jgi:hypothetical protein